jgi:hypothetical protein
MNLLSTVGSWDAGIMVGKRRVEDKRMSGSDVSIVSIGIESSRGFELVVLVSEVWLGLLSG